MKTENFKKRKEILNQEINNWKNLKLPDISIVQLMRFQDWQGFKQPSTAAVK